jgi:hypothetical protein
MESGKSSPRDIASQLAHIQSLVAQQESTDHSKRHFTAKACLKAAELERWEQVNGVALPEAYRRFLLEIGNGGSMPASYSDFELHPLKPEQHHSNLREPFPITTERFAQRLAELKTEGDRNEPLFPELHDCWEDNTPPGCQFIGHYPSYDMLFLVVNGELRGSVWCAVAGGVPELDRQGNLLDFLEWFTVALLDLQGS